MFARFGIVDIVNTLFNRGQRAESVPNVLKTCW